MRLTQEDIKAVIEQVKNDSELLQTMYLMLVQYCRCKDWSQGHAEFHFPKVSEGDGQTLKSSRQKKDEVFTKIQESFDNLERVLENVKDEIIAEIRDLFTDNHGKRSEKLARKLARERLAAEGIDPNRIRSVNIKDEDGTFFYQGYKTNLDILYQSPDECCFIEYKVICNVDDVAHFNQVARLAEQTLQLRPTRKILMTIRASERAKIDARRIGIEVWLVHPRKSRPLDSLPNDTGNMPTPQTWSLKQKRSTSGKRFQN